MSLIKCPECQKEISNKADKSPHCGCPVLQDNISGQNLLQESKKKKNGCGLPFLVTILIVSLILLVISAISDIDTSNTGTNTSDDSSISVKYIDVSHAEGDAIDSVLSGCGITQVLSFEHDENLDNAHTDGETGYRLKVSSDLDNIILYLNPDNTVHSLRYADHDLYSEGNNLAKIDDYTISTSEASNLMISCEEKVKGILKSPSTAKFPNILEWGFRKEKNIVTIQGYVDAENAFGVEMRSSFQFIIDTNSNTVQSFIFDGQEMIE